MDAAQLSANMLDTWKNTKSRPNTTFSIHTYILAKYRLQMNVVHLPTNMFWTHKKY